MDNEFEKLRDHVPMLDLNIPAANEHVGDIERRIRVVKERSRGIVCTLPYAKIPQIALIYLMHFVVMWLNNFPTRDGISVDYSPRELILRHCLSYKNHCRAPCGAYCETHEENSPTNSMKTRALPTICLGPTGNIQGTYNFQNLLSGLVIKRRLFTELPAPQSIINRVHSLAAKLGVSTNLIFADRKRVPFPWATLPDDTPDQQHHAPYPYPDIPAKIPGVQIHRDTEDDIPTATPNPPPGPDWNDLADAAAENADLDMAMVLPPTPEIIDIDDEDVLQFPITQPTSSLNPTLPKIEPSPSSPPMLPTPPTSRYPSRDRRPPTYLNDFIFTTVSQADSLPPH